MKAVSSDVKFPEVERQILAFWRENQTFEASNERRRGNEEFAFYDGPPFANGLPHYGHLLANSIKDTVPRYWNMRGFYVERRFGWDCHGLPVEFEIEKRDGLKGRKDILTLGVAQFNEECRTSVLHYAGEWQKTVTRLGRWVDWDNQYRTMDLSFMESVWWVLAELYRKGLVYEDFKVVPYSPRITAVLSNFEANQNYKDVQDPAITVKFKLVDEEAYLLGWTTTPWTLISNLALCVGPQIDYVKIKDGASGEYWYVAEPLVDKLYKKSKKGDPAPYEIVERVAGSALVGRSYEPLFPYFRGHDNAFVVLHDDYVTVEDGTGIVHQAPAFGEDDFRVCRAANIELVDPVDDDGCFTAAIAEYEGQFVKDADKDIIKRLKDEGKLVKHDVLVHSYPFCERTDTPLIYKAISTWFVAVEQFRDRLIANNQKINWVPEHLKDGRMGKWLENARDWAISRNRFWGTPIPIWICNNERTHRCVIGSVKELEQKSGREIRDLHKHFIDDLTFKCDQCDGEMRRVPEVFDCWFESGAMPYAQLHYPFENEDRFKTNFPADFIAEGLDQTRGWFYTLNVLATALFDQPAFRNVVVNGLILDESGKKMSKRHRNYTPPDDLLEKYGSDSVRLYMLNSAILKGGDLIFTDQGVKDTTRAVLLPLWNAVSFLTTYAKAEGWVPNHELATNGIKPTALDNEIDRWIISRLQSLFSRVHDQMEAYRLFAVVPPVLDFIEDLTNWYIRLNRRRFWGESDKGADQNAFATLYYVLIEFSKVFAPFAPFLADEIYKTLTDGTKGLEKSVHLCDMPMPNRDLVDEDLERRMDILRRVANLGRSLRAKHKIKTRQVLPSMLVITQHENDRRAIEQGDTLIREELNIKSIDFSTDEAKFVRLSVKPNLRTLGRRLGSRLAEFRTYLEKLNEQHDDVAALLRKLESAGEIEVLGEHLVLDDFLIERGPKDERLIATEAGVTVLLDTKLDEQLIQEGLAREVVNRVQKLRKDSGLNVSDRIVLTVLGTGQLAKAVKTHESYIMAETLANRLEIVAGGELRATFIENYDIEGAKCSIGLAIV